MITNLARGFVQTGYKVDLVLVKSLGEHIASIPKEVNLVELGSKHTFTSLPKLISYLKKARPTAMLAAKDRAIKVAVLARIFSGIEFRLVGRLGTTVSAALEGKSRLKKLIWYNTMRMFYRGVDKIIAVSRGVADDVLNITGLPRDRVCVVHNPVWRPEIMQLANEPVEHPWFDESAIPIILGAGRLTRQKDFPTLLRAFAKLHQQRPCRLIILGEGQLRSPLQQLAEELGFENDFALPGFVKNPYAYLSRSSVFVLSSLWEGSPNVLTEALALGIPVVATDCPSGPVELLAHGKYGELVAMGDIDGLAQAIARTLDHPHPPEFLKQAVKEYTVEASTKGYLKALGLG